MLVEFVAISNAENGRGGVACQSRDEGGMGFRTGGNDHGGIRSRIGVEAPSKHVGHRG